MGEIKLSVIRNKEKEREWDRNTKEKENVCSSPDDF